MKKVVNNRHATKPSTGCYYDSSCSDLTQYAQGLLDLDIPVYCVDSHNQNLAINESFRQLIGLSNDDSRPVTLADLYSTENFKTIMNIHNQVMETGVHLSQLETVKHSISGSIDLKVTKIPLYNEENHIIGVASLYKTIDNDYSQSESIKTHNAKPKVLQHLQDIADTIPVPFYWLDVNHHVLGMNELGLKTIGFTDGIEELIGKTDYDMYPKEIADQLIGNQRQVMETNQSLTKLETIKDMATGKIKHYDATLSPLHDDKGNVIGIYGISIEVTAKKEAEELRVRDEVNQAKLAEQERFKRIVSQAVHDIRSPLASMMMVIKAYADKMPEKPRTILNQATTSINAISDGLMEHWSIDDDQASSAVKKGTESKDDVILVALAVSQLLTSKHYEYQKSPVSFSHHFSNDSHFSCIQGNLIDFKRMLSNVINNAIGAYDGEVGQVMCELETIGHDRVIIRIIDHGKGMSDEVLNKVRNAVSVTSGKEEGHGIGLTQVHDTVQHLQGKLEIESVVGQGTTMTFGFPQIEKPNWLANSLTFRSNDTIIVLDDDESIHQAWKGRLQQTDLQPYLDKHTVHFTNGQEAIDYINASEDKSHLFLLTDYELLKQPLNGIEVIETTKLSRTVLVTSHYDNHKVREAVLKVGTQLLPKQLAHEVPIRIDVLPQPHNEHDADEVTGSSSPTKRSAKVVVVDDDVHFTDVLVTTFQRPDCPIDIYNRPDDFLQHLACYDLDARIYLDYQLIDTTTGLDVAKQLHEAGYQHLYLLSGYQFEDNDIPHYITVINKLDIADMERL